MNSAKPLCEIKTTVTVTEERARDLLVGAFEGGSNYWYFIKDRRFGPHKSKDFRAGGQFYIEGGYCPLYLIPFVEGCSLVITDPSSDDEDSKEFILDRAAMQRGFQVMQEKYLHHWNDFVTENDDACTSDVWLQCCLFGEVVYG
jgi:hypothetical protein